MTIYVYIYVYFRQWALKLFLKNAFIFSAYLIWQSFTPNILPDGTQKEVTLITEIKVKWLQQTTVEAGTGFYQFQGFNSFNSINKEQFVFAAAFIHLVTVN